MNKFALLVLVVVVLVTVALTLAHVSAGDEGGGGTHNIIAAILL
jgi:hypothetical protein